MASAASFFNYDSALAACKDQFSKDFLAQWRSRFEALSPDLINEVLAAFAAGENRKAFAAFYAGGDWSTLEQGASADVQNSADFATRAAAAKAFFQQASLWAARAILTILVAGFCG
jgi:hypothetical protein